MALTYDDIDYARKELLVTKRLGRGYDDVVTKNTSLLTQVLKTKTANSIRSVPIPAFVLDEIILARKRYEYYQKNIEQFYDGGYICCKISGIPYNRSSPPRILKNLLQDCGLPDMTWHGLRTTYATVLKNNHVNLKAISLYLGHASAAFTDETYIVKEAVPVYDSSEHIGRFARDILPYTRHETLNAVVAKENL